MNDELNMILESMTEDVRDRLATAVEIGKWPDGTELSKEQRGNAMQAVMLWDSQNGQDEDEPFKILKGGKLIRTQEKESAKKSINNENDDENNINIRWQ